MTWFKNLRTIVKLMTGFGLLAVLVGGVGYEGLSGMVAINDRLATLYQRDMMGLAAIKDVSAIMAQTGRELRNMLIFTDKGELERYRGKVDSLNQQLYRRDGAERENRS